jgi:ornithine carbamoyltransferase
VVGRESGVPVYDGLASAGHPTARLAGLIGGEETPARLRRLVLQTVLLSTLA